MLFFKRFAFKKRQTGAVKALVTGDDRIAACVFCTDVPECIFEVSVWQSQRFSDLTVPRTEDFKLLFDHFQKRFDIFVLFGCNIEDIYQSDVQNDTFKSFTVDGGDELFKLDNRIIL